MKLFVLAAALGLTAGSADADPLRDAVYREPARPITAVVALPAAPPDMRPAGLAKTSIDHRFARDGLDGSLGFLCGLQPSAATTGAAAATGVDPHGRFLGVKLHMSFR